MSEAVSAARKKQQEENDLNFTIASKNLKDDIVYTQRSSWWPPLGLPMTITGKELKQLIKNARERDPEMYSEATTDLANRLGVLLQE
jgi:hypothetical protein